MYLFETNKRQGFHAIAMTYLFSGAGKCLEFYYTFVGDGVTQLDVSIVGVDNVPVNTTTLTGNKDSLRWQRLVYQNKCGTYICIISYIITVKQVIIRT